MFLRYWGYVALWRLRLCVAKERAVEGCRETWVTVVARRSVLVYCLEVKMTSYSGHWCMKPTIDSMLTCSGLERGVEK